MNKNNLKSFNMNLEVAVKLSEAGKQHLIDYYSQFDYGKDYLKNVKSKSKEQDVNER